MRYAEAIRRNCINAAGTQVSTTMTYCKAYWGTTR